ncbi:MAG: dipeptide ABC transporter ATP-binding protein [Pseudomonadota bacterium]
MDIILKVDDLSISFYQGKSECHIVKGVSFDIGECETLSLVGESGSGKSLTAQAIMGLLPYPTAFHPSGSIVFDDRDLLRLSNKHMESIRGDQIGMIFQEPMSALNPLHTVEKQIGEVLMIHRRINKNKCREKVLELLNQVHIPQPQSKLNSYPHQLSGGQRQRVMIAMALANQPKLLIADEPTTALDVTVQKEILDLLKELQAQYKMSILLITHDLGVVNYMADRILVMHQGQIVERGHTAAVLEKPQHDYTKRLINSHPRGGPIDLDQNIDSLASLMSTHSLRVKFPLHKPLFGRCKHFFHALRSIDIELAQGSSLGIVGESGSGKSTLALAILRLVASEGEIFLGGKGIHQFSEKQMRPLRSDAQIVFQDPFSSLSPRMCIRQIISEGLLLHASLSKQDIMQKVNAIMDEVGLDPNTKDRYPHEFSGGQRQRIAIARALILNPKVVFLDEPTSALDRVVQMQVIELLRHLQKERKLSYVFISHDIEVIRALSHRVVVLQQGQVVEQGNANSVLENPAHPYTQRLLAANLAR